ncbi:MAG: ribonuclease HII [Candidatus Sungbacteria bacterium]|uniref:Ribonuclease n=1 Tax=Candidatus Sungiibacteriota bacterium TaxID=2750080 RepID=A0A9D6LRH4_9BACT|nr:ribonuclease HII [Candidatus Sungbacteria bacterium]
MKRMLIGGIDEAGRGPLAGPVSVALVIAPKGFRFWTKELGKIKDSKQLSPKKRELWYQFIVNHPRLVWHQTYVSAKVIDRVNIQEATYRGAARLILKCAQRPHFVFLDGALVMRADLPHKIVIGGDAKIPVVAAASIIAKIRRDRYMVRMAKKFPGWDFDRHKGYGTRAHIEMLKGNAPLPIHRDSFISHFV